MKLKTYEVSTFGNQKSLEKVVEYMRTLDPFKRKSLIKLIKKINNILSDMEYIDSIYMQYYLNLVRGDLHRQIYDKKFDFMPADIHTRLVNFMTGKIRRILRETK